MARIDSAKAMRRATEIGMSRISSRGRASRTERWSVDHRNVANDCRKNSRPPVASSWFTGALPRMGEMMSRCTPMPSSAPRATLTSPPTHIGQP